VTGAEEIRVVRGNPTPDELAAIVSVIEAMTAEIEGTKARAQARAASAWRLSQRPIRTPLIRGLTRWRSIS